LKQQIEKKGKKIGALQEELRVNKEQLANKCKLTDNITGANRDWPTSKKMAQEAIEVLEKKLARNIPELSKVCLCFFEPASLPISLCLLLA
jgi:hypothetical protein